MAEPLSYNVLMPFHNLQKVRKGLYECVNLNRILIVKLINYV